MKSHFCGGFKGGGVEGVQAPPPPLSLLGVFLLVFGVFFYKCQYDNTTTCILGIFYKYFKVRFFVIPRTKHGLHLSPIHTRTYTPTCTLYIWMKCAKPWSLFLNAWTFQTVCTHLTIKLDVTFFLIDWLNFMNDYKSMQFTFS